MRSPPHEGESPGELQLDGASGIQALPDRVNRYGKAKERALEVAEYMATLGKSEAKASQAILTCGDYLAFRHYFTIDEVRLHGASLCRRHLLCQLCAIRRGAKAMKAYLDRFEVIKAGNGLLRPFLVTLTVKDGPDLAERFKHLHQAQRELWKRKHRGRGASPLAGVVGAVWSYEFKRGKGSGQWHPHLHMIALAEELRLEDYDLGTLGPLWREWKEITGDSWSVNVRAIEQADPVEGFCEVFKYAVKFSDQSVEDTVHAFGVLSGRRLLGSAGAFRGVEVPESLTDGELENLPFVGYFYRFLRGSGYSLAARNS